MIDNDNMSKRTAFINMIRESANMKKDEFGTRIRINLPEEEPVFGKESNEVIEDALKNGIKIGLPKEEPILRKKEDIER